VNAARLPGLFIFVLPVFLSFSSRSAPPVWVSPLVYLARVLTAARTLFTFFPPFPRFPRTFNFRESLLRSFFGPLPAKAKLTVVCLTIPFFSSSHFIER